MNISDAMRETEKQLAESGVDNPTLDARLLIAHALQCERAQLLSQSDRILTEKERSEIDTLITRRARREPVSRILGMREFWSLSFGVNEATLVPRPESETLVESALGVVSDTAQKIRILDLGTGTGCLLLALLRELPNATGLGIDCAPRAVEQARTNAERLGLAARAEFMINNWVDNIDERFDLIISNPPYIAQGDIPALMPEVREHDPHLALDGGEDGLAIYRLLIPQLSKLLKPNGAAVFEIGEGQRAVVCTIFEKAGFKNITAYRDLAGIERCIVAHIP